MSRSNDGGREGKIAECWYEHYKDRCYHKLSQIFLAETRRDAVLSKGFDVKS